MTDDNCAFLTKLERVIAERRGSGAAGSYTTSLFAGGTPHIAQKVGEEAVELAIAAVQSNRKRTVAEAADLVYHLLVLLADADLTLADVSAELAERHR